MDLSTLKTLYRYNVWANHRILEAVSTLDSDDLNKDLGNSFPSVKATLVHIMSAEWLWLRRWQGESPPAMPSLSDFSDLPAIEKRWREIEAERCNFLDRLSQADLAGTISYSKTTGGSFESVLWHAMMQVVNHSTYHRGQIITMLRQLGADPVGTDLIVFFRQQSG